MLKNFTFYLFFVGKKIAMAAVRVNIVLMHI